MTYFREPKKLTEAAKYLVLQLDELFNINNKKHARKNVNASMNTQKSRYLCMRRTIMLIHYYFGHVINSIYLINKDHLNAVINYFIFVEKNQRKTIENYISYYRTIFGNWLGRPDIVMMTADYFIGTEMESINASNAAYLDLSDAVKKMFVFEESTAIQLMLIRAFGMNVYEAVLFRPNIDFHGNHIRVNKDLSYLKHKKIDVIDVIQNEVVALSSLYASIGDCSTMSKDYDLKHCVRRFRYALDKFAKLTTTQLYAIPRSLHMEFENIRYIQLTGMFIPERFKPTCNDEYLRDKEARVILSKSFGYFNKTISNSDLSIKKLTTTQRLNEIKNNRKQKRERVKILAKIKNGKL